jgi:hypothetical protein
MIRGAAIAGIFLLGTVPPMNASPGSPGSRCVAKVLKAEEFAYAPMGYWLVRVTFDITSPSGRAVETALQDTMPWEGAPPRAGQTFRLRCGRVLRLDFVKGRIANY